MDTDVTPGNFHISGAKIYIDNENIGSLNQDGAVVNYSPDVHLHMSAKYGSSPVAGTVVGVEATFELHIAETTKENLLRVLAGATEDGNKVAMGGVVGQQLTGVEVLLVPFDDTESWILHNAIPVSNVEVGYSPSGEREYVVTYRGLIDTTTDTIGEMGSDVS